MYQNWIKEMDQIGRCNTNSSPNDSSTMMMITPTRIRNKGGGGGGRSWSSFRYYNNSSRMLVVFWLILSVGSSMAVMAYRNDLSAIPSSSGSSSSVSTLSPSRSANNNRHGCVWSRTDEYSGGSSGSNNGQQQQPSQVMYAAGNNPFQQHNLRTFPALSSSSSSASSSSSVSPSSLLPSSSTLGGGGVLTLNCNVRTLNAGNGTLFNREQVEQTRVARVKCSDKLFFESLLSHNQTLFQLRNLREVQIESCKIRKVPKGVFSSLTQLRVLRIQTDNAQWSPSVGLEIESGAFQGLGQLESLDLTWSNIWTLFPEPNVLCSMRNLVKLNISRNRLTDVDEFGLETSITSSGGIGDAAPLSPNPGKDSNYCALNVQNLDLSYNNLRRINANAFRRLSKLSELRLQNNLIEELDDSAFSGLSQLKLLNLSSQSQLVALPPSIFGSMGNLKELYIQNCSISALSPEIFTGLNQLLLLDLSRNSLTSQWVRDSIFSGLVRLIVLKLSWNKLSSIDSVLLQNLQLQALYLDNNRISTIDPTSFQSLRNLHILDLSNNRISFINAEMFSTQFVLRQLFLDQNLIAEMAETCLKNCTSLEDLGLASNDLSNVPVALRGLRNLKTLDIGGNGISTVTNESFAGLSNLYGLRMVDMKLTELPTGFCSQTKELRVLNVAQNRLTKISSRAFHSCPELRALRLDANLLEELPPALAPQLPSLLWLNVSQNRVAWADYNLLPQSVEWLDLSHNQLESLVSLNGNGSKLGLRVLDASYNKLRNLNYIPPALETLRLNHNRLTHVAPNTFIVSTRLRRVELIGNQIEHLSLDAIRFPRMAEGRSFPEMYLGDNPFLCSCAMEWLTRVSQLSVLKQYPRIVDLDAIVCRPTFSRSSSTQQVIPLVEAQPKDFLCPYTTHCFALCQCCEFDACDCEMSCPSNCTCYHDAAWSSANIVECSNLAYTQVPAKIPMDATEIYLDGNEIIELGSHIFIGKKNLRSLYLNGSMIEVIKNKTFNGLKSLEVMRLNENKLRILHGFEFEHLSRLRELYLQNNLIETISNSTFLPLKSLEILNLSGNRLVVLTGWQLSGNLNPFLVEIGLANNPWTCACESLVPFRQWVASLKNTIVVDFALAKCQPTPEQEQQLLQQDGNSNNSSAMMNPGGSTTTTISETTNTRHPAISSMCAPFTQITFNYNRAENPARAVSPSSGGGNQVMNNHISSMGGATPGSSLSGPYHLSHHENNERSFPQNENIIATSTAGEGGGTAFTKADQANADDGYSGNTTFFTCLLTFIAIIILVALIAFLAGLVVLRRKRMVSHSSSSSSSSFSPMSSWWCFSKCGINGRSSALPKCLSAPSSASNEGVGGSGTGAAGDMDYYYYSDQEKLFDAYVIYSQKDADFVTEKLAFEFERGPGSSAHHLNQQQQQQQYFISQRGSKKLRLCLHYRDLCLAPDNPWSSEMILSACDASRRVVLVISNNFLNCEWSNNHFRTSVHSAIQQHCRKLIVIKLPPVSDQSISNICSTLSLGQQQPGQRQQRNKQSAPSTTRLIWGDKNFWNDITTSLTQYNQQLPYSTNLNPINARNGTALPYQIPMTASHPHHHHQPHEQQPFIALMNWTGPHLSQGPLSHLSSVHPQHSLTPQHFGYSNVDAYNIVNGQRHSHHHLPNHHHLRSMSNGTKNPAASSNYSASSSAVSSGEEFDHVYSTLDTPLESPCSDLGPGHVAFEGAMIAGAQVNRHQIQHSTSSGISSDISGMSADIPGGPPMYFV